MKWYYQTRGTHTHVNVFMNGAKCGDLCFNNEEFEQIRTQLAGQIIFIEQKFVFDKIGHSI